jgi:hypothetical protein
VEQQQQRQCCCAPTAGPRTAWGIWQLWRGRLQACRYDGTAPQAYHLCQRHSRLRRVKQTARNCAKIYPSVCALCDWRLLDLPLHTDVMNFRSHSTETASWLLVLPCRCHRPGCCGQQHMGWRPTGAYLGPQCSKRRLAAYLGGAHLPCAQHSSSRAPGVQSKQGRQYQGVASTRASC